jgi:hypothetical protein
MLFDFSAEVAPSSKRDGFKQLKIENIGVTKTVSHEA